MAQEFILCIRIKKKKLDKIDNTGKFMAFKGSDKLAYVIDDSTGKERVTSHLNYDEVHQSVQASKQPPMAFALQQSGYTPEKEDLCKVKVKLLHPSAKLPQRGSNGAAAFDIYATKNITIAPNTQQTIGTGIALDIASGYHAQVAVRSSYATKFRARVEAGLIDSDYRGEVFVVMSNNGNKDLQISQGDRLAQLCFVKDPTVTLSVAHDLNITKRNDGRFGSTGKAAIRDKQFDSTTASAATMNKESHDTSDTAQLELSSSPYYDAQHVYITTLGKHATQGLVLKECTEYKDRLIITSCKAGTAAAKVHNWVNKMKNNSLMEIDDQTVTSITQVEEILKAKQRGSVVKLKIGLMEKIPMNVDTGIPMLYFDQLHAISQHLQQIKQQQYDEKLNPSESVSSYPSTKLAKAIRKLDIPGMIAALHGILPKNQVKCRRLTRKKLQNSQQWDLWRQAEWKQLDQY